MNVLNRIKMTAKRVGSALTNSSNLSLSEVNELFFNAWNSTGGPDISEITYFTCLKTLSEAIGKMPIYLMDAQKNRISDHDTAFFLQNRPNPYMTPIQLFTYMEYCRNHYGNGYAYINRLPNGKIEGMYPLDPQQVQIYINNTEQFTDRKYMYFYSDSRSGKSYWIDPADIIHVKSWVCDRTLLAGKSVREILATSMAGQKASTQFLNDLYQHGLTANVVVKYMGDLSDEAQKKLLSKIEAQARDSSRRMISLPVGTDVVPLDLKLTDSQFYELKKYGALAIAAAFGVKPDHLNDYSKSSYANSSMQSLSFYINTLLYNVSLYEQELNYKLLSRAELERGMGYKFNVSMILRGDPEQQANVLQKLVQAGIYSPNDALGLLDRPPCENGDVHMANGAYVPLKDLGLAYQAKQSTGGGDNDEQK